MLVPDGILYPSILFLSYDLVSKNPKTILVMLPDRMKKYRNSKTIDLSLLSEPFESMIHVKSNTYTIYIVTDKSMSATIAAMNRPIRAIFD